MAERGLELKVGAFLLVAVALLVGFFLVLGNFRFSEGHLLHVDYTNSGGLREGARVKVAGMNVGSIRDIAFLGGSERMPDGTPVYVRVSIDVNPEMAGTITEGSRFFISTEGLLGEKYIEITPGPPGAAPLPAGTTVAGEPPVELQVISARAAAAVDKFQQIVDGQHTDLAQAAAQLTEIIQRSGEISKTLQEELPGLMERANLTMDRVRGSLDGLDALIADGRDLIVRKDGIRDAVAHAAGIAMTVDDRIPEMLDDLDSLAVDGQALLAAAHNTLESVETEVSRTSRETRGLIAKTGGLVERTDLPGLVGGLKTSTGQVVKDFAQVGDLLEQLTARTGGLLDDLSGLASDMRKGKGTLGALLTDREIYDDIRELILDLKRNPWKAIWKP